MERKINQCTGGYTCNNWIVHMKVKELGWGKQMLRGSACSLCKQCSITPFALSLYQLFANGTSCVSPQLRTVPLTFLQQQSHSSLSFEENGNPVISQIAQEWPSDLHVPWSVKIILLADIHWAWQKGKIPYWSYWDRQRPSNIEVAEEISRSHPVYLQVKADVNCFRIFRPSQCTSLVNCHAVPEEPVVQFFSFIAICDAGQR